ncbi:MAG: hypothetical protein ACREUA_09290 [Burkholderiales bacterium]
MVIKQVFVINVATLSVGLLTDSAMAGAPYRHTFGVSYVIGKGSELNVS